MDARLNDTVAGETRPLGEQERMLHYVHNIGGLIASHVLHLRGPLDDALLRRALDWLQRRHAMLRAHIEFRSIAVMPLFPFFYRKLAWSTAGTEPIPIRHAEGDWREVLQKDLKRKFPGGKNPRIRVTVVREGADLHHVIVTADHSIGDAQAALAGSRDLLSFLADPDTAPLANDTRLPPAMESGHTPSSNPRRPFEPSVRFPNKILWSRKAQTLFEKRLLSVEETARLNTLVKQKRATLHGAVTAAMLQAAGRHFGVTTLTTLSNAEFRKLMKPPLPNDTYGCYIDIVRTTHTLDKPFWSVASDVAFKLVTAIARHQHQASALKVPEAGWYKHELWPTIFSDGTLDPFAITSGGDTGFERQYGPFAYEGMDVVVSLNPLGPAIYVLALESHGQLEVSICYATRRIAGPDAIAILDGAMSALRDPPAD
jgi:hypothetical protein